MLGLEEEEIAYLNQIWQQIIPVQSRKVIFLKESFLFLTGNIPLSFQEGIWCQYDRFCP
jgi:hypothetical protein